MKNFKPCKNCKTKPACMKANKCLGKERAAKKEGLAGMVTNSNKSY